MTSNLSPAGSSTYSSNTLHIGDGTWDGGRDDFLLPNLVGLNFATMKYNGMGNRFRDLPEYHRLILGHGVLAAITFLAIVPAAVFIAKFGFFSPRTSVKLHVYLQILTVFLATVILMLGYFAVGPDRSLTNPHHGIGVAIYVCILVQFLYGWMMARAERRRKNPEALTRTPTKVWIHKLFGRSIASLAIVQIALGLTLYGSPKVLFILYALAGFLLVFLYLALDRYYFEKRPLGYGAAGQPDFDSDYGSYLSGSRTDFTQDHRSRPPPAERSHWGRNLLAAGGALGAYEAYKNRRMQRREAREQSELDAERRHGRPPMTQSDYTQSGISSRPPNRPPTGAMRPSGRTMGPPPGVTYGSGGIPMHGNQTSRRRVSAEESRLDDSRLGDSRLDDSRLDESRLSPQSFEDEKFNHGPARQHTWRDRLLGAGVGLAAFEGVKGIFNRRRRRDDTGYVEDYSRPSLGGSHNMVSQTDVSRVEAGQAPMSPSDPRRRERMNMAGVQPMTPTATPSKPPRGQRPSVESMSYDDEESIAGPGGTPLRHDDGTLRNSIATLGAVAGFREWNRRRRDRREEQRADRIRRQEIDNEEMYNRRHSNMYPRPQDTNGRRPSMDGTVMTGATHDQGFAGSNPELSRTNFNSRPGADRLDTMHPPLPAGAGTFPASVSGAGMPPSTVGPSISQQRIHEMGGAPQNYSLPPPPSGPPPGTSQPVGYRLPEPGSLQMPPGAVEPDPSRLMSSENVASGQHQHGSGHTGRDTLAAAGVGAAAAGIASEHRQRRASQSESPSRYHSRQETRNRLHRPERRGSVTSASASQVNTDNPSASGPASPPVAVKVNMHKDGRHVTLRRLNEEEQAAERAQRKKDRHRRRRGSSLSSNGELDLPPGSNQRYRRNGGGFIRRSSDQPITDVPPPPAMSNSAIGSPTAGPSSHRPPSELNLPPPAPPKVPQHSDSPASMGLSPPAAPYGSGLSGGGFGSPGDAGTGTDVSNFADNRRRRRAERARKLEAARGTGQRVAFDE